MATAASYLIIQIPAFFFRKDADGGAASESPYALAGLIVTLLAFITYCWIQITSAMRSELVRLQQSSLALDRWKESLDQKFIEDEHQRKLFQKHDKSKNNCLNLEELKSLFKDLDLDLTEQELRALLKDIDKDQSGEIDYQEFKQMLNVWLKIEKKEQARVDTESGKPEKRPSISKPAKKDHEQIALMEHAAKEERKKSDIEGGKGQEIEKKETEEEGEEEFLHLSATELQLQAIGWLLLGTFICTIVSDPMVDVISTIGTKMNVSPFYISFVITPLASNASEVISGLAFAKKKTVESISLTLATLHGGATMNSTLCLGIFMALVYFRNLSWSFSAEVITVLCVIITVGLNSLKKNIFLWQALIVASLYPLSILLVFTLQSGFGLD